MTTHMDAVSTLSVVYTAHMANTIRRPSTVQQLARANAELTELRDRLARVETFRERLAEFGGSEGEKWAAVLAEVLAR